MSNSGVTTESGGRQNMFPSETRPYIDESLSYDGYPQNAEKVNFVRYLLFLFHRFHKVLGKYCYNKLFQYIAFL